MVLQAFPVAGSISSRTPGFLLYAILRSADDTKLSEFRSPASVMGLPKGVPDQGFYRHYRFFLHRAYTVKYDKDLINLSFIITFRNRIILNKIYKSIYSHNACAGVMHSVESAGKNPDTYEVCRHRCGKRNGPSGAASDSGLCAVGMVTMQSSYPGSMDKRHGCCGDPKHENQFDNPVYS